MKFRIRGGSHGRMENGVNRVYRKGDLIEMTEAQAKAFGDAVEPVIEAPAPEEPQTQDEGAEEPRARRRK